MSAPAVSVVLPVHNHGRTLPDAMESVLGQTFADIELIVVDDGSTDDSGRTAQAYAELDSRVRVVRNGVNSRFDAVPWESRNDGLAVACGRYAAYLDADMAAELPRANDGDAGGATRRRARRGAVVQPPPGGTNGCAHGGRPSTGNSHRP